MKEKLLAHYGRFVKEEDKEVKVLEDEVKKLGFLEWYAKLTRTYDKGVIVVFCNEDKYSRSYVKEWNRYERERKGEEGEGRERKGEEGRGREQGGDRS
jgi:hypothetical protein